MYSPLSEVLLLTSPHTKTSFYGRFCVSTRKQRLQRDSDPAFQLGQTGRGEWHQMAERGSLPPFHKGGLQLPPGLCAPKMTSPAGLGEVPAAARRAEGAFSGPSPTSETPPAPHSRHRGYLWKLHTPESTSGGVGAARLVSSRQLSGGQAGEVCKTTKETKEGARATGRRNKGV